MADNFQTRNVNLNLSSAATGFLGTVWGKVVAILAAISLLMGIALEVQSFIRGNYELETARNNAVITGGQAAAASDSFTGAGGYRAPTPQLSPSMSGHDAGRHAYLDLLNKKIENTSANIVPPLTGEEEQELARLAKKYPYPDNDQLEIARIKRKVGRDQ